MLRVVTPVDERLTSISTGRDHACEGRPRRGRDLTLADAAVHESEEVSDGIVLDFDDQGRVVGIEILDASTRTGNAAVLANYSFDLPSVA